MSRPTFFNFGQLISNCSTASIDMSVEVLNQTASNSSMLFSANVASQPELLNFSKFPSTRIFFIFVTDPSIQLHLPSVQYPLNVSSSKLVCGWKSDVRFINMLSISWSLSPISWSPMLRWSPTNVNDVRFGHFCAITLWQLTTLLYSAKTLKINFFNLIPHALMILMNKDSSWSVSYTHLTLPTICSV